MITQQALAKVGIQCVLEWNIVHEIIAKSRRMHNICGCGGKQLVFQRKYWAISVGPSESTLTSPMFLPQSVKLFSKENFVQWWSVNFASTDNKIEIKNNFLLVKEAWEML